MGVVVVLVAPYLFTLLALWTPRLLSWNEMKLTYTHNLLNFKSTTYLLCLIYVRQWIISYSVGCSGGYLAVAGLASSILSRSARFSNSLFCWSSRPTLLSFSFTARCYRYGCIVHACHTQTNSPSLAHSPAVSSLSLTALAFVAANWMPWLCRWAPFGATKSKQQQLCTFVFFQSLKNAQTRSAQSWD